MATGQPSDSVTSAVSNREIWQRLRNAGRWILPRPLGWRHEDLGRARRHFTWVLAGIASTLVTVLVIGFLIWRLPDAAAGLWLAQILVVAILVTLIGVALVCVQRCFLQPLADLRDWAAQVRGGNLAARLPAAQSEEFAGLAQDVNELSEALQALSRDMNARAEGQTARLARKTRSLELLYQVAASMNLAGDIDGMLTRLLYALRDLCGARAACARLLTDEGRMRLVASVGPGADTVAREGDMPAGECACARALIEGTLVRGQEIKQCEKLISEPILQGSDVRLIAIPLQHHDRTLGVYNLFVDNDSEFVGEEGEALLTSIGRHLGIAIEKGRLDQERQRLSRMEERAQLANELHDSLAQTLASLRFQVRVLDETLHQGDECKIWEEMERVESSLDEAYTELRELIAHFRAPIDKRGLVPAVETAIARFRQETDMPIFFQNQWQGDDLPEDMELQVLRIIQEALTNIRKHSRADAVRVLLRSDFAGRRRVLIEDDGVGFDEPQLSDHPGQHIGLSILHERAARLGGNLRVESEPGEGTRVLLTFQYPNAGGNLEAAPAG